MEPLMQIEDSDSESRMSSVCRFIEHWFGPRQFDFGEPESNLSSLLLPLPLRRLYQFAGRWPLGEEQADYAVPVLSSGHRFLTLDNLRFFQDNTVVSFFEENQDVWQCYALTEGDDCPVWCTEDDTEDQAEDDSDAEIGPDEDADWVDDDGDEWSTEKKPLCTSLSRFLVSIVLQSCLYNSRLLLTKRVPAETGDIPFDRQEAQPLWLNGPQVCPDRTLTVDYFLWHNCLVYFERAGSAKFSSIAANSQASISFLERHVGDQYLCHTRPI